MDTTLTCPRQKLPRTRIVGQTVLRRDSNPHALHMSEFCSRKTVALKPRLARIDHHTGWTRDSFIGPLRDRHGQTIKDGHHKCAKAERPRGPRSFFVDILWVICRKHLISWFVNPRPGLAGPQWRGFSFVRYAAPIRKPLYLVAGGPPYPSSGIADQSPLADLDAISL